MNDVLWIVEEFETVVDRVSHLLYPRLRKPIHYMYGSPIEIVENLQELSQSITAKDQKFPLVALFTDIVERKGVDVGMESRCMLNVIIATSTQANYKAPERLEKNFKPILAPIATELITQILFHSAFYVPNDTLKHEWINRFQFGKEGLYGKEGNIYNDYIDAIELRNIELSVRKSKCKTISKNF